MKRKLLFIVLAVVMALACTVGLAACGKKYTFEEGTYDLYFFKYDSASNKQIYVKSDVTFTLKEGTVYQNGKEVGTYKTEKSDVTITLENEGRTKELHYYVSQKAQGVLENLGGAFGGGDNMNSQFWKHGATPQNVVEASEYYNQQQ